MDNYFVALLFSNIQISFHQITSQLYIFSYFASYQNKPVDNENQQLNQLVKNNQL